MMLALAACFCRSACLAQEIQLRSTTVCPSAETIDLSCPMGSLIKVENITYGTAEIALGEWCNHPGAPDCSYVETDKSYGCNGKQVCRIATNSTKYYNSAVPKCIRRTSYLHVVYLCIPVTDVADMCSPGASLRRSRPGASWGFVGTTAYPRPYAEHVNCSYVVYGKRILLYAVNVQLDSEGDCLEAVDDLQGSSWCGGNKSRLFENEVLTFSDANVLRLSFTSDGSRSKGGGRLWLYFTAEPLQEVTSHSDSSAQSLGSGQPRVAAMPAASSRRPVAAAAATTRVPSAVPPDRGNQARKPVQTTDESRSELPAPEKIVIVNNVMASLTTGGSSDQTLAMTLGIIFGGLSLILMGVVVLYLVRRYKCGSCGGRKRSPSTHQVLLRNVTAEQFSNIANDAATDSGCEKESNDFSDWKNNLSCGYHPKEYPCKLAVV